MSNTSTFRQWLKRVPQPSRLRVDGDEKRVIKISNHSSRWSEAESTVLSYDPTTVEALDVKGEVIRAITLKEPEEARPEPQRETWPAADEAQMAMIITASNDRAVSRHVELTRLSIDGFKELYREALGRLEEAHQRIARLEAALQAELAKQEAAPAVDPEGMMATLGEMIPGLLPKLLEMGDALKKNGAAPKEKTQ